MDRTRRLYMKQKKNYATTSGCKKPDVNIKKNKSTPRIFYYKHFKCSYFIVLSLVLTIDIIIDVILFVYTNTYASIVA